MARRGGAPNRPSLRFAPEASVRRHPESASGPPRPVTISLHQPDAKPHAAAHAAPRKADTKQLTAARRVIAHLRETVNAPFSVELWDGSREPLGKDVHPDLRVKLTGPGVIGALLRKPTLEHAVRLYATGRIELLGGSLVDFGDLARVPGSTKKLKGLSKTLLAKNALPFLFSTEKGDAEHDYRGADDTGRDAAKRDNGDYIRFHYDLGNDFYKLFLDPRMQYSCGYFTDWNNTLEQAQHDKLDMICRKLRLQPGDDMLDIGFGWGGLVIHAAQNYGVKAHGVTLSEEQYAYTVEKVRELGLEDRITLGDQGLQRPDGDVRQDQLDRHVRARRRRQHPRLLPHDLRPAAGPRRAAEPRHHPPQQGRRQGVPADAAGASR